MKKGSRKKQYDQVDEHETPTEPLPHIPVMFFPPVDQSMYRERTVQDPFAAYQGPQQSLPAYPYAQNSSSPVGGYPYSPSWAGAPAGTNYGGWSAAAWGPENTQKQPTQRRSFLPACVGLSFLAIQLLLIVRFGTRFLNLSPDITWVNVVTVVSAIFVLPFQVLWSQIPLVGTLVPTNMEVYTLVAILIYGVLSRLLVGVLKILLKSR